MNTDPEKRSIAVVSGFGAQNIGNVFFNVGGLHVAKHMFPDHNVQHIQDQPGYWTFNRRRQNHKNYFQLISRLDIDYIVLQGPVFSATLPKLWDYTLEQLYKKGTKVIYLSSAFFKYTDEEIALVKRFLKKYPPALISTRDAASYEHLTDVCEHVYNGICSAWFVPDVYEPIKMNETPFIAMNFDRMPEPNINFDADAPDFQFFDRGWSLSSPGLQYKLSRRGKASAYIGAALDFRRLPARLLDYDVVRPEHRTNPHFSWKIYGQPGGFASDEPYSYFNVYANASLTLTDRVHACLMTLAYGNPAMLFTVSPRSKLFDRVGLHDIKSRPVTLDPAYLHDEKQKELQFLEAAARHLGIG